MLGDPRRLLPLKPVVFQILLILSDGERHGWSLVHALQERTGGERLLPGNFYRVLKAMLAEGLVEEAEPSRTERELAQADTGANAERRRYVRLSPFGREAARAEARRLEALVAESRTRRLLSARRSSR
jgi:DNA-binding PadR family transcriptional regulator